MKVQKKNITTNVPQGGSIGPRYAVMCNLIHYTHIPKCKGVGTHTTLKKKKNPLEKPTPQ